MLAALEGMIAELRQIGVPISLSEKIDAVRSLQYLPLAERDRVKSALRAALAFLHMAVVGQAVSPAGPSRKGGVRPAR